MVSRPSVSRISVRPSVCPSVFRFQMITRININGFSPNLVCALILWRSGLGLLMGKIHQMFTELSACHTIMAGYYSLTFLLCNNTKKKPLKHQRRHGLGNKVLQL